MYFYCIVVVFNVIAEIGVARKMIADWKLNKN